MEEAPTASSGMQPMEGEGCSKGSVNLHLPSYRRCPMKFLKDALREVKNEEIIKTNMQRSQPPAPPMKTLLFKGSTTSRKWKNKSWRGIRAECTGRPGTCTLLNKKRFFPVSELQKESDNQNKIFMAALSKLAELEAKKK